MEIKQIDMLSEDNILYLYNDIVESTNDIISSYQYFKAYIKCDNGKRGIYDNGVYADSSHRCGQYSTYTVGSTSYWYSTSSSCGACTDCRAFQTICGYNVWGNIYIHDCRDN